MGDVSKAKTGQHRPSSGTPLLPPILGDNPIERAERSYIRHSREVHDWLNILFRWGLLAAQWLSLAVAIMTILGLLVGLALGVPADQIYDSLFDFNNMRFMHDMSLVMLCVTLFLFFLRKMELLNVSSATIQRERSSQTFETMLLTGISARRVVVGKWWAAVRSHLPNQLMLIVMQAGCMSFAILQQAGYTYATYVSPHLSAVLIAFTLMSVYSVIDVGFTASLGLLASFVRRRGVSAAAVMMRGTVFAAFVALMLWSLYSYFPEYPDGTTDWSQMKTRAPGLAAMISPFLDQGVVSGSILAMGRSMDFTTGEISPLYFNREYAYTPGQILAMLLVAFPFYLGGTWALLRAAEALGVRDGLTPHADSLVIKPKRQVGKRLNTTMPEAPRRLTDRVEEVLSDELVEGTVTVKSHRS